MARLIDQILDAANLHRAWEEVAANRGIAGVDGITVARWSWNWEERLIALAADVRASRYKPARLRARRIPKRRRGEWRTLRIPTLQDRILQRAAYHVLGDLYEPVFLDCSVGYRPRRGLRDAVQRILTRRDLGFTWLLDADVDEFFDRVDHAILMRLLRERVHDPMVIGLLEAWLAAARTRPDDSKGIPMGSPISPLLANVYLHPLDCGFSQEGWEPVRYADDFVVLTRDQAAAERAFARGEQLLRQLKLTYEPSKTAITSFDQGWDFVGVRFERNTYSYIWEARRIRVRGGSLVHPLSGFEPEY